MVLFLKPTVLFAFALQPNLQQEQQQQQQQQRLSNTTITTTTIPLRCTKTTTVLSSLSSSAIHQDETGKCVFGKKEYWDDVYQPDDENANANEKNNRSSSKTIASYSWYCNWNVLKPFWNELVVKKEGEGTYNTTNVNDNTTKNDGCYDSHKKHILIAGIGNDSTPFDMYYQDGWTNMTAFDYSHAGIERARALFRERQQQQQQQEEEEQDKTTTTTTNTTRRSCHSCSNNAPPMIDFLVADARNLPLADASVDATLDKGTLDAIYISGKDVFLDSIRELERVTVPGGIVVCISRVVYPDDFLAAFTSPLWDVLRDGTLAFAPDGEATIDLGADLFAFRRTSVAASSASASSSSLL